MGPKEASGCRRWIGHRAGAAAFGEHGGSPVPPAPRLQGGQQREADAPARGGHPERAVPAERDMRDRRRDARDPRRRRAGGGLAEWRYRRAIEPLNETGNAMSMSISSLVAVELVFGASSKW